MYRFTLTEADAKRFGVDAFEYDLARPRLKEIRELSRQCGLTWDQLQARLPGGKEKADSKEPDGPRDLEAAGIIFWLAALRAGVDVRWDDFDIDLYDTGVELAEDPNRPAPAGASTT